MAVFGVFAFRINFVVVGRQHGVLARTDGVMVRIVPAAAAEASEDAMVSAAVAMVRVIAAERP